MDSDRFFSICFPLTCQHMICGGIQPGWYQLVAQVLQPIEAENQRRTFDAIEEPVLIQAGQIKQKWGTLRIHLEQAPEWAEQLVRVAETTSATTCEVCGEPGQPSRYNTLCDRHQEHYGKF